MTDELTLLAEFRADVPFADPATTARIYREATLSRSRSRSSRRRLIRRNRLTLALAATALVLAAAAVAAVKEVPWWQEGPPPVDPHAVASVAADNLPANVAVANARTVATAGDAALVAVPLGKTGYCLIPALGGRGNLGAQCQYRVTDPERGDDDRTVSATRPAAGDEPARWIVYGRITDPRAQTIDLGRLSLGLAPGGFFLANLPDNEWSALSGTASTGEIIGNSGSVLRYGCVDWGPAPDATGAAGGESPQPLWRNTEKGASCRAQQAPAPPTIYLGQAKKLFDVTLAAPYSIWKGGETVTFEAAPASDGTTCVVVVGPGAPSSFDHGCAGVTVPPARAQRPAIDVALDAQLVHEDGKAFYAWAVTGSVDPSRGIAKLEVRSGSDVTAVTSGGGFFFTQLRETTPGPLKGTVPLPAGSWEVVGYDGAGTEVARVDLVELQHRASPHP
ncbi:MAG: hypothetical protein ACJ77E_16315 [Gaiellaceae bacterium]